MWKYKIAGKNFEFNNTPFCMGETRLLDCQFGKNYKANSKPKLKQGNQLCLQGTRKKDCPAHITIREFFLYPDYKIISSPDLSNRQLRGLRESAMHDLQKEKQKGSAKSVSKYYVCLPSEEAHHEVHPTKGEMALAQKIHPMVVQKIHELVKEGITETHLIKSALKIFVESTINIEHAIDPNDRAYNPTVKDIRNHVLIAKSKLELSSLDQENASLKIEAWKKANTKQVFF